MTTFAKHVQTRFDKLRTDTGYDAAMDRITANQVAGKAPSPDDVRIIQPVRRAAFEVMHSLRNYSEADRVAVWSVLGDAVLR